MALPMGANGPNPAGAVLPSGTSRAPGVWTVDVGPNGRGAGGGPSRGLALENLRNEEVSDGKDRGGGRWIVGVVQRGRVGRPRSQAAGRQAGPGDRLAPAGDVGSGRDGHSWCRLVVPRGGCPRGAGHGPALCPRGRRRG